jgi:hypothetical protein
MLICEAVSTSMLVNVPRLISTAIASSGASRFMYGSFSFLCLCHAVDGKFWAMFWCTRLHVADSLVNKKCLAVIE